MNLHRRNIGEHKCLALNTFLHLYVHFANRKQMISLFKLLKY